MTVEEAKAPLTPEQEKILRGFRYAREYSGADIAKMWATIDTLQARVKELEGERDEYKQSLETMTGFHDEMQARAEKAEARVKEAGTDRRTPGTVEVCPDCGHNKDGAFYVSVGGTWNQTYCHNRFQTCDRKDCPVKAALRSTPPTTAQDGGGT